jgi:hypothetical protein
VSVADDVAGRFVERVLAQIILEQADLRLAAFAVLVREVRANEFRLETNTLGCEQAHQELMRFLKSRFREAWRTSTVLVRDEHERVAGIAQPQQGGDDAIDELELGEAIDLLIRRLDDQRAVAIDEQDLLAAHAGTPASCSML